MKVEINTKRIHYLLALYEMSDEELMALLNEGRKRTEKLSTIMSDKIELSLLKRIDSIFNKGLSFYTDFSPLPQTAESSVFFRKKRFETKLNLESKRVVNRFEALKDCLDAYSKLADVNFEFRVDSYTLADNPKEIAKTIREIFHPGNTKDSRQFLKEFINKCADQNIYVFEFIETWNKKERTNMDGLFLCPNMIVLKRQKSYKREIFTLAHELGHCLLRKEEIESIDLAELSVRNQDSDIERWCNDFAFYFIMGEAINTLNEIKTVDSSNDYCHELITSLSTQTNISRLAIYTRLYLDRKMSYTNYVAIKRDIAHRYEIRMAKKKEETKNKKGGSTPKPILSRLYVETLQYALFKGVINETTFCQNLNIKSSKIQEYLW